MNEQIPPRSTAPDLEPETVISVRDLRVQFGDREVLHGIDLDVRRGETLVILGGSGSGKSTLLRVLVGLQEPSGGHIHVRGVDLFRAAPAELAAHRQTLGISLQGGAPFHSMTGAENVSLP